MATQIPEKQRQFWCSAYVSLVTSQPELVDAYERIASLHLSAANLSFEVLTFQPNEIEQQDQLSQFRQIAEQGLSRMRREILASQHIKKANKAWMISEMIDKALGASCEVSIPWVGTYLALEVTTPYYQDQSAN